MKKSTTIIIVLVIIIGIYFVVSKDSSRETSDIINTDIQSPVAPVSEVTPSDSQPATKQVSAMATVDIKNFLFNPPTMAVKVGTKVTWTNSDSAPHTATAISGSTFDSGKLTTGQSFSFIFNTPGTTEYLCSFHPGMKGNLVVTK